MKTLDQKFAAAETALEAHRVGDGWKLHNQLSVAQLKHLSDVINALAEPVSKVAAVVSGRWPEVAPRLYRRQMLAIGGAGAAGLATATRPGARRTGPRPVSDRRAARRPG